MAESINAAIIERLEKVVSTLQDNSMKMGQLLAVHNEKLDKQDRIDGVLFEKIESMHRALDREANLIKAGCERDIRKVDDRLQVMEKKMWTIFGGLAVISFLVSVPGQSILRQLQPKEQSVIMNSTQVASFERSRQQIHQSGLS
tara:strand:- start:587 stop:1018 length:432 start_codon:yes stop_codon:yes gene_type:complete